MRVVLTGASGFIGQKLSRALLERGHEVVGVSRNRLGEDQDLNRFRHIRYVMGESLPEDVVSFSPEILVHLAWDGIPDFSAGKCADNVTAQLKFIQETKKLPELEKIVVAGSCREYGDKQGACVETERNPPDDYFSWAKQTLADYFGIACRDRHLDLVWFRIFYIYGPGQRPASLIPTLIRAFESELDPQINNPLASNDYIFIEDVLRAFEKAIEGKGVSGTFNLGSGKLKSALEVSKITEMMIRKECRFAERLAETHFGSSTVRNMFADISRAKSALDWTPQFDLPEGIAKTLSASR